MGCGKKQIFLAKHRRCVMISFNSLLFPRFVFQEEVTLRDSKVPFYKLHWDEIDKIRRERFVKSIADGVEGIPVENLYPFTTLPHPYNKWVKDMTFAISNTYMEEIRRYARLGIFEWSRHKPISDTMIRDICLEPAIQYIYVAFRLIVDCMYDKKVQYYYRGPDKAYAPQALLYKFWSFQTGSGLIKDHAQFRRIENFVEKSTYWAPKPEIEKFFEVIKIHEKKLFKMKKTKDEKEEMSDFFSPGKIGKILQMPGISTVSIPIGDEKEFINVKLKEIVLLNQTCSYPNFAHKYEMKASTTLDNPDILKRTHRTFSLNLYKSKIALNLRGIRVKGYSLNDATCRNSVTIRMSIDSIETCPQEDCEYKHPSVVKNIDLEKADKIVLEELGNKVIMKKGRIKLRGVMDDVLGLQESTSVKDVDRSKIVANIYTPDNNGEIYPEELKNRFDFCELQGPPPKDPFEVDPENTKPYPTKESLDGQISS